MITEAAHGELNMYVRHSVRHTVGTMTTRKVSSDAAYQDTRSSMLPEHGCKA